MKTLISSLVFLVLALGLFPLPVAAQEITGLQIMTNEDEREDGDDHISRALWTLINKRGQKRIRDTTRSWKDYDGRDGFDEKMVMFFKSPPEVEGTGFLNWSYPEIEKDDDKWLYLPALRKIKRISGSDTEDSFMGTDFTFDDMGDREVEEDTHKLLREEVHEGKECYVVESVPKEEDYIYSKKITWIDKKEWLPYRVEFYDRKGRCLKYLIQEWQKIQGIWTWKRGFMKNERTGHQTVVDVSESGFNTGLDDSVFTQRTLRREGK
jgi:outer membrane lipoprotein-sorting protein